MSHTEVRTIAKPKLADTELIILSSAANRDDHLAIPVPETLTSSPDDTRRALTRLLRATPR